MNLTLDDLYMLVLCVCWVGLFAKGYQTGVTR